MITELEPRIPRQKCPFCGEMQEVFVNGHYPTGNKENTKEVVIDRDRGYSFCNCRNIYFTAKENLEASVYSDDYADRYDVKGAPEVFSAYSKAYFSKVKEIVKGNKFIEIGAIVPFILNDAKAIGFETTALDIIPHKFEGHECLTENFETMPDTDKKFDVIWASHIFEHFVDPIFVGRRCFDMLNDGGILFVAMPDPFSIDFGSPYSWSHWHLKEHHIMWDMDSFCKMMEEHGFKTIMKHRNFGTGFICIGDYHLMFQKDESNAS